jgi:hypothetical protein
MEQESADPTAEAETAMISPPGTPSRSTCSTHSPSSSSSMTQRPLGPELTPSKFPGLLNDPLLSEAANTATTEDKEGQDKEGMDFQLLDDASGGDWADDI